jgi:hypothetical protein
MAKSMRVNRNKKYSKRRRTNNRVTNKKSARREKKRNSRRNNNRRLRGGIRGGAEVDGGRTEAQVAGPTTTNNATSPPANNAPTQVEGFSNPLYDAVKDQEQKVTLKTNLTERITVVMDLLTKKYLEKPESVTNEQLTHAIGLVTETLDKLATKEALESKYQSANLFGLTTILGKLKEFIQEPSTGQELVDNVREYHNRLFFYLNAYNQKTDAELEEFLKQVKDSSQGFTRAEYENFSSSLPFTDKLAAADLLYGTKSAPEPGPEPETTTSANPLVGGTLVRVIKEGDSYRAQIESESK